VGRPPIHISGYATVATTVLLPLTRKCISISNSGSLIFQILTFRRLLVNIGLGYAVSKLE